MVDSGSLAVGSVSSMAAVGEVGEVGKVGEVGEVVSSVVPSAATVVGAASTF